jgi:hypothetical protein
MKHSSVVFPSFAQNEELVKNGINGLTFTHRDEISLAVSLEIAILQPEWMKSLGEKRYLYSNDGCVPSIESHSDQIMKSYQSILQNKDRRQEKKEVLTKLPNISLSAPWRITFDTNPDDCNFSCTMCEQHSDFSPHKIARKASKARRNRMDFSLIENVVKEASQLGLKEIIPTTMGEPLMYKEFPKIIELCHRYGIKMNLTTNGSFYGRGVRDWAYLLLPICVDIKISWNGNVVSNNI